MWDACVCVFVCACVQVYVYYTHVYLYIHIHTHTLGDASALNNLGALLLNGLGAVCVCVCVSLCILFIYIRLNNIHTYTSIYIYTHTLGDAFALNNLGALLLNGLGGYEKNETLAFQVSKLYTPAFKCLTRQCMYVCAWRLREERNHGFRGIKITYSCCGLLQTTIYVCIYVFNISSISWHAHALTQTHMQRMKPWRSRYQHYVLLLWTASHNNVCMYVLGGYEKYDNIALEISKLRTPAVDCFTQQCMHVCAWGLREVWQHCSWDIKITYSCFQ